jgi:hypothetical protein
MKDAIRIILIIFSGLSSQISFAQDTIAHTFKIERLYATAAGKTGDTIVNRQELIDSAGITIHGCENCKLLGFKLLVKTKKSDLADTVIKKDSSNTNNPGVLLLRFNQQSVPSDPKDDIVLQSKTEMFTAQMKEYIENNNYEIDTYYIEIFDIKVSTKDGERVLKKICLFLK